MDRVLVLKGALLLWRLHTESGVHVPAAGQGSVVAFVVDLSLDDGLLHGGEPIVRCIYVQGFVLFC